MLKIFNIKSLSKITFVFFFFTYFFFIKNSQANNFYQSNTKILIKTNKSKEQNLQPKKSLYLVGPGDILSVEFRGVEFYSGAYSINPEGFIDLPEIGNTYVKGITVEELKLFLQDQYKSIIFDPDININILNYRPVSIYVSGEVKKPGLYTLNYQTQNNKNLVKNLNQNYIIDIISNPTPKEQEAFIHPKLFDALRSVDGVSNNADLSKIEIIRDFSRFKGGGKIKTKINLLRLITNGDQTQNIRIMDGDHIIIPKSEKILKEQLIAINNSNLNPGTIQIYITGNVLRPGPLLLEKGSSLIEAIASTGGKKLLTGNIEFIRFNDDGSTQKRKFRFNENAKINTERNPILMNGDIINVKKTILGSTTEIIKEISSPVLGGYGLYKIFN